MRYFILVIVLCRLFFVFKHIFLVILSLCVMPLFYFFQNFMCAIFSLLLNFLCNKLFNKILFYVLVTFIHFVVFTHL